MDKKTLIINTILIVLIFAVGIGFASYVYFTKHPKEEEIQLPNEEVSEFDSERVTNQKIDTYRFDMLISYLGEEGFYSGFIDLNQNRYEFENNDTEEKLLNVPSYDVYSMFQTYLKDIQDWEGENVSFSLNSVDQENFEAFLNHFQNISFHQESMNCEVTVDADTGLILEVACQQKDLDIYFVFYED